MGQLLQRIPRHVCHHLVGSHAWRGPKPREFSYWSHLRAMLFGQGSARKSLRDLACSLHRQGRKFYHLGFSGVKRSTLAEGNEPRPAIILEKTYFQLYERLSAEQAHQPQDTPKSKTFDATTIDLCAAVFPWAKCRTCKGAIKLHTVLTEMLPHGVIVTDGKTHDRQAVKDLHVEPGDLLIFERAYLDYAWLYRLHRGDIWFLTRLRTNSCYEVIQAQEAMASGLVLADQIIRRSSPQGQACYPELLRRVHHRDPETGKEYVFLANHLDLPALQVAELYRHRWQIELFFKWIKQNLKSKAFYGTSHNAVLIQIGTALIAYLLLVRLKCRSTVGWGLLELTRRAQTMLLERGELWAMLCPRSPDNRQPLLFNARAGQQ